MIFTGLCLTLSAEVRQDLPQTNSPQPVGTNQVDGVKIYAKVKQTIQARKGGMMMKERLFCPEGGWEDKLFFLTGHPKEKNIRNGADLCFMAKKVGHRTVPRTGGGEMTVEEWEFVAEAKP
jgi:hypothetical protein